MSEPRGFAVILFALGFVSLLAFLSFTMQIFTRLQLRRQLSLTNRQEGYVAGEILAWHSYFRKLSGLAPVGSQDERGRYIASFPNRYDEGLTLGADPYDPSNYQPGMPLNLATTLQYDSGRSVLRRYTGDNLRYLPNASGSLHCGHMIFAKKGRGICLVKADVETGKTLCGGKITIKKSTPPYCKGLVATPSGAAQPVTTISNLSELRTLTTMPSSGYYKLTQDIDCLGALCFENPTILDNSVLDGNGHTIRNVGGFLMAIDNSWVINLHIENINVNATVDIGVLANASDTGAICIDGVTIVGGSIIGSNFATGGLIGKFGSPTQSVVRNSGIEISVTATTGSAGGLIGIGGAQLLIEDSHACGIIQTTESGAAGGLVGTVASGAIISRVSTGGEVRGKANLGGIAGIMTLSTSISKSRSSAKVLGSRSILEGGIVGGLVGSLIGADISDSYATGDVEGLKGVGGLVGVSPMMGMPAHITNCYSTGKVTSGFVPSVENPTGPAPAPGDSGGLISGLSGSFSATSSYWDTDTSLQSQSGGGTGKTTSDMKIQATFSGWDFTQVWKMPPNDYPRLKWEP